MIFSVAGMGTVDNRHAGAVERSLSRRHRGLCAVFEAAPDSDADRKAIDAAGINDARIQNYDDPAKNEVLISLPRQSDETSLDQLLDHYKNNPFDDKGIKLPQRRCYGRPPVGASRLHARFCGPPLVSLPVDLRRGRGAACFHSTLITVGALA